MNRMAELVAAELMSAQLTMESVGLSKMVVGSVRKSVSVAPPALTQRPSCASNRLNLKDLSPQRALKKLVMAASLQRTHGSSEGLGLGLGTGGDGLALGCGDGEGEGGAGEGELGGLGDTGGVDGSGLMKTHTAQQGAAGTESRAAACEDTATTAGTHCQQAPCEDALTAALG
jgi:hypothetical protein